MASGYFRTTAFLQLLVDADADVNLADDDGVLPLAHSLERGYLEIAEILRNAGAKANY